MRPDPVGHTGLPTPAGDGPRDERVSTLVGDRVCVGCGFNLCGQPVLRERHYRMLIARCPECSTVAALQEYPLLGRWANRWAALAAALWLMVLVGALFASAGVLFGMSLGAGFGASQGFAEHIGRTQKVWYDAQPEAQKKAYPQWVQDQLASGAYGNAFWVEPTWWDGLDRRALFRDAGGWRGAVRWSALWMWVPVFLAASGIGVFYSIALLGVRRRRLLALALAPICLAGVFALLSFGGPSGRAWGGMYMSSDLAQRLIAPRVIALTLAFALPCLWLGVWVGRPLARAAVCTLLPVRMRAGLSLLWVADSLEPPGVALGRQAAPRPMGASEGGTR